MTRLSIGSMDRVHFLVWREHPTTSGKPGWRVAQAVNGVPVSYAERFPTWPDAMYVASGQVNR